MICRREGDKGKGAKRGLGEVVDRARKRMRLANAVAKTFHAKPGHQRGEGVVPRITKETEA